ncbi:MAG: hypothetical protein RLZ04_1936 [Actinomycetota bacterium]|jgi:anti-sigma B factor antagonist
MRLVAHDELIDGMPVLALDGDVDLATLPVLRDHLTRFVAEHPARVVAVDIESVGSLDDSGLGALLGAAGRARQGGGDLVVLCAGERLRERFAITGLDRAIEIRSRSGS